MEDIKLYSSKVCPFAHRSRLALAEKQLEYILIEIDLRNKPSWYREINPLEAVPALVHGEFIVTESLVINEYINELSNAPFLLPKTSQGRALARRCIVSADATLVPSFYRLLKAQTEEDRVKAGDRMLDALCQINEDLEKSSGPYLFGSAVTLADIAIFPWFERWQVLEHYRGLEIPEAMTALFEWLEAMQERESVKSNKAERDYYITEYADYASGKKRRTS